jgi:SNF2 family DNA or RNA helicase
MPTSQSTEYSIWQENTIREAGKKGSALEALLKIRTISLHPGLVNDKHLSSENFQEQSARLSQTIEILDIVKKKNEKALIFCETRQMQAMLAEFLKDRYDLGHIPIIINGTILGAQRKAKVDIFQQRIGFDVMILSPKAGGVGLTLTAANHVIHLTRWWNPAVEDQCTDRVYRIGQKKEVNVYYPQAIHPALKDSSFDIVLNKLLEKKRSLNKRTLSPTQITDSDLHELFESITN